ncbi:hypothetical protein Pst134EA_021464 [Puccinia striiformis f. sp. tritici]|uniref:hypothetical protein n=1 Tax=Puccinia striiformis f. sp. tritici TaxID=168172 RepID=UPI0020074525|nr:hypothetical protein Pst134EA_021464 [Puccinia striiformis f. sp. tritici]KAH9457591.1 hypothetical protein Pst134EA_021464 [Puccinia striiformis f. sp. tritici]
MSVLYKGSDRFETRGPILVHHRLTFGAPAGEVDMAFKLFTPEHECRPCIFLDLRQRTVIWTVLVCIAAKARDSCREFRSGELRGIFTRVTYIASDSGGTAGTIIESLTFNTSWGRGGGF